MALSIATGYTEVGTSSDVFVGFADLDAHDGTGFKPSSIAPNEVYYTATNSPMDQPTTIHVAQRRASNIYAGTGIDPASQSANRSGLKTLIEVRQVWAKSSSTDETFRELLPVRAALTLDVPVDALITSDMVEGIVLEVLKAACPFVGTGVTTGAMKAGLDMILRGVLTK